MLGSVILSCLHQEIRRVYVIFGGRNACKLDNPLAFLLNELLLFLFFLLFMGHHFPILKVRSNFGPVFSAVLGHFNQVLAQVKPNSSVVSAQFKPGLSPRFSPV